MHGDSLEAAPLSRLILIGRRYSLHKYLCIRESQRVKGVEKVVLPIISRGVCDVLARSCFSSEAGDGSAAVSKVGPRYFMQSASNDRNSNRRSSRKMLRWPSLSTAAEVVEDSERGEGRRV